MTEICKTQGDKEITTIDHKACRIAKWAEHKAESVVNRRECPFLARTGCSEHPSITTALTPKAEDRAPKVR